MRRSPLSLSAAVAVAVVLTGGCDGLPHLPGGSDGPGSGHARSAEATLQLADGTTIGDVDFDRHHGMTEVEVRLDVPTDRTALRAFHGFHVHANDDPANGEGCVADPAQPSSTWFVSADGHLKSGTEVHGAHDGDMPPLLLDGDGRASATFATDRLALDELDGRVVILHAGPDNLGNVSTGPGADQYTANSQAAVDKTHNTGNAGDRVACGVIHTR
jgi:Cu-Zn family superoxide dismutase